MRLPSWSSAVPGGIHPLANSKEPEAGASGSELIPG